MESNTQLNKINITAYKSGRPFPLGASFDGEGTNFAIYSENADAIDLCLFNALEDDIEAVKISLRERTHHVWHVYLPGIMPGQLYGFRVDGPYIPAEGHRFNAHKLLLDPYAKAIAGKIQWDSAVFGYELSHEEQDLSYNRTDSVPYMPKCVVTDPEFDWQDDKPPAIPYHETIIYEAHVKGLTMLHPDIPEQIRGTYSGISHPVTIKYLKDVGITAIELMPVHQYVDDHFLVEKGLSNYWGYNTIGFFAPEARYSSSGVMGEQVIEFKTMVRELHKAGIEVIIDVVYNHTAEGNEFGPTLSFRGIDNCAYYRTAGGGRHYMDYTGCGNTLNTRMPNVLRLIMDSLRYWIEEMHVDGFRFDLAATLARELHEVNRLGAFFDIVHQDPVISTVKLIAEPWDVGEGGFQIGKFPPGWGEWNGLYRDCIRDFWRGSESRLAEFARRFTGSSDLYEKDYRHPTASINFITAHDGFTLRDLVSYENKHNDQNHDNNTDGTDDNFSCNYGTEGDTNDESIIATRKRQQKNFMVTLFLSQGVPMLYHGDEIGNSQYGNNNTYCQDSDISWVKWDSADVELHAFVKHLIAFRKAHPSFTRKRWFRGQPIRNMSIEDIAWFTPDASRMDEENWHNGWAKALGVFMNGLGLRCLDEYGEKMTDDNFFVMFNAHEDTVNFKIPGIDFGSEWKLALSTADNFEENQLITPEDTVAVPGRSILVLVSKNFSRNKIPPESLPDITER